MRTLRAVGSECAVPLDVERAVLAHLSMVDSDEVMALEKLGILMIPAVLGSGLLQLALGYMGLEYLIGTWAAVLGLIVALGFRVFLPMSIGSFFGAVHVPGRPWWAGVLVVLPGLVLLIPGIIATAIEMIRGR